MRFTYVVLALAACSHPRDVNATYNAGPIGGGAVEVVLNGPTSALSVTVDDALVVDRKYSRRARIDGVPPGLARVHVATGGGCEQAREYDREVEVAPGGVSTVALPGGEPNVACALANGLVTVATGLEIVGLAILTVGVGAHHAHR